jgi:LPXTG-motif cell wall-anchored protein
MPMLHRVRQLMDEQAEALRPGGKSMLRKMFAAAGLGITAALLAVSPAMATYPPSSPSVGTPSSNLTAGSSTTLSGDGWQPGSTVQLTIASTPQSLGSATVAGDGTFSATVSIPCVEAGTHTITASGTASDGSARSVSTTVTVGACGASGTLPHTGGSTSSLLTIVAIALLVGTVLVIAASRRRTNAVSQR